MVCKPFGFDTGIGLTPVLSLSDDENMKRLPVKDWPPLSTIRVANETYRLVENTTDRNFSFPEDVLSLEKREICRYFVGLKTDSKLPIWRQWDEETLQGVERALRRDLEGWEVVMLNRLTSNSGRKPRCSSEFVWELRLRRQPERKFPQSRGSP